MVSCGNNSQFGFPEGRFRTVETELKLRSGFKPFSIAFAQVNKQECKITKIGFRSFSNPECRRITPCILLYSGVRLFPNRASEEPISYGNNGTASGKPEAVCKETSINLMKRYDCDRFLLVLNLYDFEITIVIFVEGIISWIRQVEDLSALAIAGTTVAARLFRLLFAVVELVIFLFRAIGVMHYNFVLHLDSFGLYAHMCAMSIIWPIACRTLTTTAQASNAMNRRSIHFSSLLFSVLKRPVRVLFSIAAWLCSIRCSVSVAISKRFRKGLRHSTIEPRLRSYDSLALGEVDADGVGVRDGILGGVPSLGKLADMPVDVNDLRVCGNKLFGE